MKRRILIGAGGLVAATILAAVVYLWQPLPANPSYAELAEASVRYDAEIMRDEWGVPHIYGARDADVSFGLAYAHAEDDFETIQETVAATRGVLARYRGAAAAPTDYIVGFLGIWDTLDARYEMDVPAEVRALADGYAAGLNLYAAENPEATWSGLAPFYGRDVIAGFMFKTPFFYGLDKTLQQLFEGDTDREIALAPIGETAAWLMGPSSGAMLGSNAIAVSAARSTDGVTRLLINSHQPMTGPVAWYEAHLISDQGLNITGGLFPGTPLILHGFNRDLGWANTVNSIDLADVYVLTRNPENRMQYMLDGEWRDFKVQDVEINVGLVGPFAVTVTRKLLLSEHGPVVERDGKAYALRYAGRGEIRQLEQYYALNRSSTLDEFLQAMAMNALPSINYVFADKTGNIGFIHNAQYPDRIEGWAWDKDLPGDRSDLIWKGYRPFADVPKLINPESGLVFNANNTPFTATDGADNLTADKFSGTMGLAENETNRSMRLVELSDGVTPISRDRLLAIKFDDDYSKGSNLATLVEQIVGINWQGEPKLAAAAGHLKQWNRSADRDNRHAALAVLTARWHSRNRPEDFSRAALGQALTWAADFLETYHGGIDVPWGAVNRLVRGDVSMAVDGGPDTLRAIYAAGDLETPVAKATHGDTWIGLVEWAPDGTQSADVIHQFGSATLDEASPHYADQAPLFVRKEWRRAVLSRQEAAEKAVRRYRPGKTQ